MCEVPAFLSWLRCLDSLVWIWCGATELQAVLYGVKRPECEADHLPPFNTVLGVIRLPDVKPRIRIQRHFTLYLLWLQNPLSNVDLSKIFVIPLRLQTQNFTVAHIWTTPSTEGNPVFLPCTGNRLLWLKYFGLVLSPTGECRNSEPYLSSPTDCFLPHPFICISQYNSAFDIAQSEMLKASLNRQAE